MRHVAEFGSGWIAGGGDAAAFAEVAQSARTAWTDADRTGSLRTAALAYFSFGPDAAPDATRYLGDYYGFADPYAKHTIAAALTTPDKVRDAIVAYSDAGCDELIIFPCTSDPAALQRLADVLSSAR